MATQFRFKNSTGKKYDCEDACIDSITFPISRGDKYKMTIRFEHSLTEREAVRKVEKWLSKSAGKEYFGMIKDDLCFDEYRCTTRGGLLGSLYYLESIQYTQYTRHATLSLGS